MEGIKGYTKEQYLKGNPKLNLALNERRLIILALLRSNWDAEKAFDLNYPRKYITLNGYRKILSKHHISLRNKKYLKLSEIN